uniref:Cytochrome b-c1 complex subunit 9 n=3 Tax=Cyprinus carpio TaxID=7962 RepID=A0A8C1AKB1_CYPCA
MGKRRWSRDLIDSSSLRPLFRKNPLSIMALARSVYNLLFRRTSTFAITIMVGAVVFERVFDQAGEAVFDNINKGKLWKHIKHNYEQKDEE